MHRFKSAILAIFHFCQNGTFEPVLENQKNFWPKLFFWSIMKMAIRNFFISWLRVRQIQDLCRKKYKKGIFSDVQWWKQISAYFSDSTHQEYMIFARNGPCYNHWNEFLQVCQVAQRLPCCYSYAGFRLTGGYAKDASRMPGSCPEVTYNLLKSSPFGWVDRGCSFLVHIWVLIKNFLNKYHNTL